MNREEAGELEGVMVSCCYMGMDFCQLRERFESCLSLTGEFYVNLIVHQLNFKQSGSISVLSDAGALTLMVLLKVRIDSSTFHQKKNSKKRVSLFYIYLKNPLKTRDMNM